MKETTLITSERADEILENSPAPRVTKEYIEGRIADVNFYRIEPTVTVCSIVLDNGYSVRGESACVNLENYNQELGERFSYNVAFAKLWPLFGFLLAESNFKSEQDD